VSDDEYGLNVKKTKYGLARCGGGSSIDMAPRTLKKEVGGRNTMLIHKSCRQFRETDGDEIPLSTC